MTASRAGAGSVGHRAGTVGPWTLALVAGAILQVVVPLTGVERIAEIADANASRITPAGWAFTIWTPIFVLALAWAGWRVLRGPAASPAAAATDRWLALAFLANAAWEWVFPSQWFVPAQLLITGAFLAGVAAFVTLVRGHRSLSGFERWVALPLAGLYTGWITAATLVGLLTTGVALGWVGGATTANAVIGTGLIAVGLAIAVTLFTYGTYGDWRLPAAYLAAVAWALVAIVAGQWADSRLTAVVAGIALVALLSVAARRLMVARAR